MALQAIEILPHSIAPGEDQLIVTQSQQFAEKRRESHL
jgi:hypothetical protein